MAIQVFSVRIEHNCSYLPIHHKSDQDAQLVQSQPYRTDEDGLIREHGHHKILLHGGNMGYMRNFLLAIPPLSRSHRGIDL